MCRSGWHRFPIVNGDNLALFVDISRIIHLRDAALTLIIINCYLNSKDARSLPSLVLLTSYLSSFYIIPCGKPVDCSSDKMSFLARPPKPQIPLGYPRIPSPTASVKVSPIALGDISIGSSWSEAFGQNEDPFTLLDTYLSLDGNFIDTSNVYNFEDSERLIGE